MTQKKIKKSPINRRNYDGTKLTGHTMESLLPRLLGRLSSSYQDRPDLILDAWPGIIGKKLAKMTHAEQFKDGVLHVKVKNSTLYSLLVLNDRQEVLKSLRLKFPKVKINNIFYKIK